MAKAKKSATSKKMNYGGMAKMKSGGSKFPDLTGDGKVTRADILKGRGVIKKHGGVHAGMADRFKNPKSASMMRYGGMKKAQTGISMSPARPTSQPERIIETSLNPSTNRVQQKAMEEKAKVANTQTTQSERIKRQKVRQTEQTARQVSRNQKKVDIAMIKAGMNPKETKKKGGSVKYGKKK